MYATIYAKLRTKSNEGIWKNTRQYVRAYPLRSITLGFSKTLNKLFVSALTRSDNQRTAKDLTHLEFLEEAKLTHVINFYNQLAAIYSTIRDYQRVNHLMKAMRSQQAVELLDQTIQLCRPMI